MKRRYILGLCVIVSALLASCCKPEPEEPKVPVLNDKGQRVVEKVEFITSSLWMGEWQEGMAVMTLKYNSDYRVVEMKSNATGWGDRTYTLEYRTDENYIFCEVSNDDMFGWNLNEDGNVTTGRSVGNKNILYDYYYSEDGYLITVHEDARDDGGGQKDFHFTWENGNIVESERDGKCEYLPGKTNHTNFNFGCPLVYTVLYNYASSIEMWVPSGPINVGFASKIGDVEYTYTFDEDGYPISREYSLFDEDGYETKCVEKYYYLAE